MESGNANALFVGERQKRLRQPEVLRFLTLLESLPIVDDQPTAAEPCVMCFPFAREYGSSAYDAAYLEMAVRCGAALATLDTRMAKAVRSAGVAIFFGLQTER